MAFWKKLFGQKSGDQHRPPSPQKPPVPQQVTNAPGFAVIDIETTGLSPYPDRIVEIAIVQTDAEGKRINEWESRVNPEGPVGATHVHGITQADVANSPTFAQLAPTNASMVRGRALVAHNAKFDLGFIHNEFQRAGWNAPVMPHLCTLVSARVYLPGASRYTLQACCDACGVRLNNAHSALGDARATTELLQHFLNPGWGIRPLDDHLQLPYQASRIAWPTGPTRAPAKPQTRVETSHSATGKWAAKTKSKREIVPMLKQVDVNQELDQCLGDESAAYVEILLMALEDGELSDNETRALQDLQQVNGFDENQVSAIHAAVASALADRAVEDDVFSKHEREELKAVMRLLGIPEQRATAYFKEAQARRYTAMSEGLPPLPSDWNLGEPLRVGDRVAFTGIDDTYREKLERLARDRGVYVGSAVTKKTAMLVTDGSYRGGKFNKANELGTRMVTPDNFEAMLKHIQPYRQ